MGEGSFDGDVVLGRVLDEFSLCEGGHGFVRRPTLGWPGTKYCLH